MSIKFRVFFASVFVVSISTSVSAAVILDQMSAPATTDFGAFLEDVSSVYGDNAYQAQTFTVGVNGTLDHIDVLLGAADPSSGSFTFELRSTNGAGAPDYTGLALATATANYDLTSSTETYTTLDFSSAGIAVSAGDSFAIVGLTGSGVGLSGPHAANWLGSDTDPYSGGAYYASFFADPGTMLIDGTAGYDLNFRTYVDTSVVPVPATVWLFGSGLIGMIGVAKRKRS